MKRMLAAAATLLAAACTPAAPPADPMPSASASAPVAAAGVNPLGTFNFSTTVQGDPVTGSIEVTGTPGAYGGTLRTSVTPDIPLSGVTVQGQRMVVTSDTPDGQLVLTLNFEGNAFTGGWTLNGGSGDLTGQRVP